MTYFFSPQFIVATLAMLLAAVSSQAGTTANGCTYQVINGKYVYSCASSETDSSASAPAAVAPAPQPTGTYPNAQKGMPTTSVASDTLPVGGTVMVLEKEATGEHRRHSGNVPGSQLYLGGGLGGSNFRFGEGNATGGTAFALQLGGNASENIGIELGYSYQSIGLYMGLDRRAGGTIITPGSRNTGLVTTTPQQQSSYTDASMSAHLLTLEAQFLFTDTEAVIRPFVGGGFAYKYSRLQEDFPAGTIGNSGGSIEQNAFGMTATAGLKGRLGKNFQLAGVYRFLFPISTGDPVYNTKNYAPVGAPGSAVAPNLFNNGDTRFTSAGLGQIVFTAIYLF